MSKKKDLRPLTCKIEGSHDRFFKISFSPDDTEPRNILIAKKHFPKNLKINDTMMVKFYTEQELKNTNNNLARNILDEIIGNNK